MNMIFWCLLYLTQLTRILDDFPLWLLTTRESLWIFLSSVPMKRQFYVYEQNSSVFSESILTIGVSNNWPRLVLLCQVVLKLFDVPVFKSTGYPPSSQNLTNQLLQVARIRNLKPRNYNFKFYNFDLLAMYIYL